MNTVLLSVSDRIKEGIADAVIGASVAGARWSPAFREHLLRKISDTLARAYIENYGTKEGVDLLALHLWFGRSAKPFFMRLLGERPRAARKLAQLAYVWSRDMRCRRQLRAEGSVSPVTVVLEPTGRCNLRCPGCYANSTGQATDLPYEVWREVVAQARDLGVTIITLSGGEPFLREAQDKFITRMAAEFPRLGFLVYTNATMIDEEVARRLGDVANVFPAISVEGYEQESDARRGKGYWKNATQVRERLARHQVMYGFSATVTRQNAALVSSDEFIERRLAEGDMFGWYFILQPIGRKPDTNLMVTPEQRAHLRDQVFKWRKEGRPIILGDFWNDGLLSGGCIAGGRSYFHIYSNGDISPCVFAPVACGNVVDILNGTSEYRSLADFVNRHPFFVKFRQKQAEITDWRAPCVLIDHPEKFRAICAEAEWFPGNNMPDGYIDGEIARVLDCCSKQWREALARMPIVPECAESEVAAIRSEIVERLRQEPQNVGV